jgi:hypothetical protein
VADDRAQVREVLGDLTPVTPRPVGPLPLTRPQVRVHDLRQSLTAEGERVVGLMRQRLTAILGRQLDDWPPGDQQRFAELFARFTDC